MPWMSCSGRDVSGIGSSIGNSKGNFMIASGLLPGALEGIRTPNLLIRRPMESVQSVRRNPSRQVSVLRVSGGDAIVRYRPVSP